ncbi:MAG TPA: carboxypeptidase regulatory-like domain-containing protein [Bryobacteraceae bacterium]|nr:carboxypeptidase regulatory-like domain-containing protein [Bryobacteraceae bacterium]
MTKIASAVIVCFTASLALAQTTSSNSGTIQGSVLDPSHAAVVGALVNITNPVSHYDEQAVTDGQGKFELDNIPFNNYHMTVTAAGFQTNTQDVSVRTAVPLQVNATLVVGTASTTVEVTAAADLVENVSTTHTDVDRALFDKLPLENQSSSLSSLVTLASPGIAADSNGLFHGLGDHASNSFSLDGQPITDQQSKVFSNQIPVDAVESMEVIEGAPPAEYGDKDSVIIVVTTRSGLGVTAPHGDVTASYGSFGTTNDGFDFLDGGKTWGNFISANALQTSRFLDGPEFAIMHDHGNEENFFDRIDFKPSASDSFNINLGFTRSWFQTPNSYDAQDDTAWNGLVVNNNGIGPNGQVVGSQDQRSKIQTFNIAPTWTHLSGAHTIVTVGAYARQDQYNYYPSRDPFADLTPDLQLQTVGQNRTLTNLGLRANVSYVKGIHNLKIGANYMDTILTEKDAIGIVDPTNNAPCLNPDGSPDTNPLLTDPANCTGQLTMNPNFIPLLGCYDLTRTGTLPASDGCPNSTSGLYHYYGHANIRELALFVEDTITKGPWSFNLGLRGDIYDGIVTQTQPEPRLGIAYNIKPSGTVLRVSYARTLETPFNENLVLSSEGCNDQVVAAIMSSTITPCVSNTPLSPGFRNEFHAGLEQAFGRYFVLDGEYIWKYTHLAYDFSVLGDTPITFPIEWSRSKIPGFAIRGSMPNFHGLSAFIVMSSVAARFFEPQVSGIGAAPVGSEVFRIDHDEKFNQTTHVQYQPFKNGPWLGFNWRYDSGLVAGPVPCAGGNCANGPNGTDTIVDVSGITPDQQFQAGLSCAGVYATPTMSISPTGLCPASEYASKYVSIPAAGTENDDHNPPRIASRSLFDLSVGDDNLFHGEKRKWSLRLSAVNLTNKEALYNFISTFSGTHYVTPRALTATIGFHF